MPSRKGSKNKRTLATEKQLADMEKRGVDPKDYIESCLLDPAKFDAVKMRAAEILMEYTYAKLSRQTIDGKLDIFKHEQALKELE